jgi:hypothetical protein
VDAQNGILGHSDAMALISSSSRIIEWDGCFMPMHEPRFWNKARMENLFLHLEVPELDNLMAGYLIQDEFTFCNKIAMEPSLFVQSNLPSFIGEAFWRSKCH